MAEAQSQGPRFLRDVESKATVDPNELLERLARQTEELERAKVRLEQLGGMYEALNSERRARTAAARELEKERRARQEIEQELEEERSANAELEAALRLAERQNEAVERQMNLSWTQLQTLEADFAWRSRSWWRRMLRRPPARKK